MDFKNKIAKKISLKLDFKLSDDEYSDKPEADL
jgi:hypothetical protein